MSEHYQADMKRGSEARAIAKAAVEETWDNPVAIVKALEGFDLGKDEIFAIARLRQLSGMVGGVETVNELTKNMDDWIEQYLFENEG